MKPSPDISWVVEKRGVTLMNRRARVSFSIPYPAAGLWALLANGNYSLTGARDLMAILMSVSAPEAEQEVLRILAGWRDAGLLQDE